MMTIRKIHAMAIAGACLFTIGAALTGCDRQQSALPPAESQSQPSSDQSSIGRGADASATAPAKADPALPHLKQPFPSANDTPVTTAAAEMGNLPAIPVVDLDALPQRLQKKLTAARKAVDAAPGSSRAICELGALYLGQNLLEPAIACFRRAIALVPNSSAPPYFLALTLAQAGDDAGAIKFFGDVVNYDPNYMPARIRQADLQYKTDKARAAEMYRRAIDVLPEAAFPHFRLGRCLLALGKRDEAEREFLKAVELQPDYADAHGALGELYSDAKQTQAAERHKQLAASGKPSRGFSDPLYSGLMEVGRSSEFASNRALSLAAAGQINAAMELLRSTAAKEPEDMQCVATLARIYESIGNYSEASQLWEQVYAIDAKWPSVASRLANAYANSNRLPKAISTLRSQLKRTPDDVESRQVLAVLLAKNRETDDAIAEGEQVLRTRGESAQSFCEMAQVLIECKKFEEAARMLDKAQALDSASNDIPLLRGMLHDAAGDADKAYAEYERAFDQNRKRIGACVAASRLAGQKRDWARQLRILKAGIESNPNVPAIAALLAHLLATCPEGSIRNGAEAVKLAEQICTATGMSNHEYLDILGEALAEAGEFDRATSAAKQAINIAKQNRQTEPLIQYQIRLELYESRKPYHLK